MPFTRGKHRGMIHAQLAARERHAETSRQLAVSKDEKRAASLDAARGLRSASVTSRRVVEIREDALNGVLLETKTIQCALDEHPHRSKLGERIVLWQQQFAARLQTLSDIEVNAARQKELSGE